MRRICLIDDDPIYRYTVKRLLKPYFSEEEFEEYEDGQLALDGIKENLEGTGNLSDLFLVDVNMPLMNGWEFLEAFEEHLEKLEQAPKIYMVSSSTSSLDTERVTEFKFLNGYITKPVEAEFIKKLLD